MSTALALPAGFGPVSTLFAGQHGDENLASGITGGFAVISYKGKVWAVRSGGSEIPLMRADGDGPRSSLELVIVKSSPFISKVYYEKGYVPGSDEAPDCFSNNGTVPDPSVTAPQCTTCAACPMNAWGSRINQQNGKQGKACADSKRLAVMPLDDLDNKSKLGPMLLRVPAASLQDTKTYAQALKGWGYDYFTVGTRVSFDIQEAFPKFVYSAIRPLNDDEAKKCLVWRNAPEVDNILNAAEVAPKAAPQTTSPQFEQPPATPATDTVAAQIAALQKQMADQNAAEHAAQQAAIEAAKVAMQPTKTAAELQIEELQRQLAAAQNPTPTPPPPPAKTPEQLQIEELQRQLAAAQTPAPTPVVTKTPEELQMEALQKQLADMQATRAQEATKAAEAAAEKERKKQERAAKKAADDAAKKAAEEANATTAPAGGAQGTMEALQAQLAALQAKAAGGAPQATQQVLQGEVIPPTPATTTAPAENTLSTASIEAKLAALLGKTA